MPHEQRPTWSADQRKVYQIRLKGRLAREWAEWFEGLTITQAEDGSTLLTGPVVDQAALYGLLKKARNLGLPLLSVNAVDASPPDPTAAS